MRPLALPDLNPLDFDIWSILEAKACTKTHDTVEGFKVSLKKAWPKIPQEKFCVSVESFRGRIERVVKAKGGHIEIYTHILFCDSSSNNIIIYLFNIPLP